AKVRSWYPAKASTNWLVPCCRRCNGSILADRLFMTFGEKFAFARWRISAGRPWRLTDNAAAVILDSIEAPSVVREAVAGFDMIGVAGCIVETPQLLDNGAWRKRRSVLCKPQTLFTPQSATASCRLAVSMVT